jgi:hypothetical protein
MSRSRLASVFVGIAVGGLPMGWFYNLIGGFQMAVCRGGRLLRTGPRGWGRGGGRLDRHPSIDVSGRICRPPRAPSRVWHGLQAPMIVAPARATAGKAGVSDIPRACEECLPRLRWTCHKRPESLAKSARPDRTVARRRLEPEGHWVKRVTAAALTRRPRAPETVRLYANDWTAFVTW